MKILQSIRGRLFLWYGLFLAGMLAGFGYTAWELERASRLRQIDHELQQHLAVITQALRAVRGPDGGRPETGPSQSHGSLNQPSMPPRDFEPQLKLSLERSALFDSRSPSGFYYCIWLHQVTRSPNAPAGLPRPGPSEISPRQRGEYREMFLSTPPVDYVLVGKSIADDLAVLRGTAWLIAGAGLAVLALGLAGGWWLTTLALRPVQEIGRAAIRIATGDLSERINLAQTESELGGLALLLNATFERLEASFAQQARFTSDAAHELRTPLTILLTQTQAALARDRSASEYREALAANQTAGQRMRRLIESLLDLARLDAGQEPLRRVASDLAEIAAETAELITPLTVSRQIKVHLQLSEAHCEADPERIAQVVTNLLKNAIDYNRDAGEIRLTVWTEGETACLEVADTGLGISAEHLPHVFERFYRADAARSGAGSRTGLGLAISKAIVDAHGGALSISSELKKGTSVILRLPCE